MLAPAQCGSLCQCHVASRPYDFTVSVLFPDVGIDSCSKSFFLEIGLARALAVVFRKIPPIFDQCLQSVVFSRLGDIALLNECALAFVTVDRL